MDTVIAIVTGAITILLAIIIFANIYSSTPDVGIGITNESWAFDGSNSGTFTKALIHPNLVSGSVAVYNSSVTYTQDTDYTVNLVSGEITNMSTGLIGGHSDFGNYTDTFGVDYDYVDQGFVTAKGSIRSIFYSSMNLVVIGFIVLAAVFILAIVGRLRMTNGGD